MVSGVGEVIELTMGGRAVSRMALTEDGYEERGFEQMAKPKSNRKDVSLSLDEVRAVTGALERSYWERKLSAEDESDLLAEQTGFIELTWKRFEKILKDWK